MAQIAFYKAKHGNWLDYIIAATTFSKYSHCEFVLSDGTFVGCSPRDSGVRTKKVDTSTGHWDIYDLPESVDDDQILWFYNLFKKYKYDWVGAFTSLFDIALTLNKRMYCSEFCAIVLETRPSRPPSRLYKALVRKKIISSEPQE